LTIKVFYHVRRADVQKKENWGEGGRNRFNQGKKKKSESTSKNHEGSVRGGIQVHILKSTSATRFKREYPRGKKPKWGTRP